MSNTWKLLLVSLTTAALMACTNPNPAGSGGTTGGTTAATTTTGAGTATGGTTGGSVKLPPPNS